MIGDWNATPDTPEWEPLKTLETQKEVSSGRVNAGREPSHLVRLNASGPKGSRIDLHLITKTADAQAVPEEKGVVIQWSFFDHLNVLPTGERRDLFNGRKKVFSDHLPVVSRFHLAPPAPPEPPRRKRKIRRPRRPSASV